MCNEAVEEHPRMLIYVPNRFKTREMCDDAVRYYPYSLQHVPDWFLTQQQIKIWYDNNYVHNNEGLGEWYDGFYDDYKKWKAQKAKIKKS